MRTMRRSVISIATASIMAGMAGQCLIAFVYSHFRYIDRTGRLATPVPAGYHVSYVVWCRNIVVIAFATALLLLTIRMLICRRKSPLQCPDCGYDLRGCTDPGCPECGWNRMEAGRGEQE